MKRILVIVLCAILLLGMLPMEAEAAQRTLETPPDRPLASSPKTAKGAVKPRIIYEAYCSVNKYEAYVGETLVYEVYNVNSDYPCMYRFTLYLDGYEYATSNWQLSPFFSRVVTLPGIYEIYIEIQETIGDQDTFEGFTNYSTFVYLRAPKITKIEALSGTSLKISWNKVSGADGYDIWRGTSLYGWYDYVGWTTRLSFSSNYLKAGTKYYYIVSAYAFTDTDYYEGENSAVKTGVPLSKATIKSVVSDGSRKLKVTWAKVTGASGYKILRSTTPGGVYKQITTTTKLTYTNAGLVKGKTYYYKIQPYKRISTTSYVGPIGGYKGAKVK